MNVDKRKTILAILGSTRKDSSNESILNYIAEKYKNRLELIIYKGINELPFFNPDIEDKLLSDQVINFRKEVEKADGVLICTPEYVFSIPGVLKNALEWTVSTTVFSNKPVSLIVASGLGDKAYESLMLIMKTIQADVCEDTSVLINGARSKIDNTGNITDEQTKEELDKLVSSFISKMNKA